MSKANVVFTLEGANLTIQCSKSEKMRDICERFATKSEKNINSLIFLYGGGQLNLNLTFEGHANSMDKANNEMKVLVYPNEVNWLEIKSERINKGKEIMRHKLESNLNTKDLNQIINILIYEIISYPGFCDLLQDAKYFNEVFDELKDIAKTMGQKYINQKILEEKQRQENEQILMELIRKAEEEEIKRKIYQLKKEIKERRREIEVGRRNSCFPKPNYNGCSIVDALKTIGANSRYEYRSIIAARNGIENYVGSPKQNIKMLKLLKKGHLLRP